MISNRDGIGTRIAVTTDEHTQIQEINIGASYLSSHDPRCHFGLGTHTSIDRLEVRWQSGVVQVFENLPANQAHTVSEFSDTPADTLFKAAWTGDVSTVRGMDIDVNLKDTVGRTPLHIAAEKGNMDVVMFLIENGANVNVADVNGNTPLVFIINKAGNLKVIQRLLEKGARVNVQNRTGETALMYAAWHGHSAVVQLLLENRADVTLKNRQGRTALTLAESKGHQEIVEDAQSGNEIDRETIGERNGSDPRCHPKIGYTGTYPYPDQLLLDYVYGNGLVGTFSDDDVAFF